MKRILFTDFQSRYTVGEILHKACFLDPRFKSLCFLSEETKQRVMLAIKVEVIVIANLAATVEERYESGSGACPKEEEE